MKKRNENHILFVLVVLCTCHSICSAAESDLLLLRDDRVVLGVKAELGGRVMLFRREDGENVLHTDPDNWKLTDKQIPAADHKSPFVEYQGHIIWIGPQKKWWADQDGNLQPPGSGFFPDPYLVYDRCEVLEHTPTRLLLQGHVSPLNGMQMKKKFELLGNGKVRITAVVTNKRNRCVTWNIWSNTRFNPNGKCWFIPGTHGNLQFSFSAWAPQVELPLQYKINDGKCSFIRPDESGLQEYTHFGKISFNKYIPIYAVYKDNLFKKEAEIEPGAGKCPSESLPLEIYQRYSFDQKKNIMELEFQSPEFSLEPENSKSFSEIWSLAKTLP